MGAQMAVAGGVDKTFLQSHPKDPNPLSDRLVDIQNITTLCVRQKASTWNAEDFMVRTEEGTGVLSVNTAPFSIRSWTVLSDANGKPLAVCTRKVLTLAQCFYIYGFAPRVDGQQPSGEQHNGVDLYSWAVVEKPLFECTMRPALHVYMASRSSYFQESTYVIKQQNFCSSKLEITKDGHGCCTADRALFQFDSTSCYMLKVAPGVDTALMVCLILIKDEMIEASGKDCNTF
mmetsp:Transcript_50371/g.129726  ORF Transcript_50371/g.129726 Transcript_50371/m.129726 type:complete len:232 (-) Transcript_50371:146-841(-)